MLLVQICWFIIVQFGLLLGNVGVFRTRL